MRADAFEPDGKGGVKPEYRHINDETVNRDDRPSGWLSRAEKEQALADHINWRGYGRDQIREIIGNVVGGDPEDRWFVLDGRNSRAFDRAAFPGAGNNQDGPEHAGTSPAGVAGKPLETSSGSASRPPSPSDLARQRGQNGAAQSNGQERGQARDEDQGRGR